MGMYLAFFFFNFKLLEEGKVEFQFALRDVFICCLESVVVDQSVGKAHDFFIHTILNNIFQLQRKDKKPTYLIS